MPTPSSRYMLKGEPRFDHPLTGQAIADFAKSVWAGTGATRSTRIEERTTLSQLAERENTDGPVSCSARLRRCPANRNRRRIDSGDLGHAHCQRARDA
jgi:hypothetical protein